jgi:hypothetical protein
MRGLAVLGLATLVALMFASPARAVSGVSISARLNGIDVSKSTERHPIKLDPKRPATLDLVIRNEGDDPLEAKTVRLEGRVLGLTFYAYDTTISVQVSAHATETRKYTLDLAGLEGQAIGLIPSRVLLLDPDRHVIAERNVIVDVRGSLRSVYGTFGLAVAMVTALSIAGTFVALARNRLHPNRWRRALRFLVPGLGVGLVLVFSLSAFRVLAPLPSRWWPCLVGPALVFFVLGYLTPTPDSGQDEDKLEEDLDEGVEAGPSPNVDAPPPPAVSVAAAGEAATPEAPEPAPQTIVPSAPATILPPRDEPT